MLKLCVACLAVCFLESTSGQDDNRIPPSITNGPTSQKVIFRIFESVTLNCAGKGVPDVVYEWKKNGQELNQPNINYRGADGTLTIQFATSIDEGFYQCLAKNPYGTALTNTTHLQRAFLETASINRTVLSVTVQEGQPFLIQANARRNFPTPTYGWEVASDVLDVYPRRLLLSRRLQMAENGDLHFGYALPEDELGEQIYKCTAYNPYLDIKATENYAKVTVTRSTGGIGQFAPTLGFSSETQTVAVVGGSVTLRCFFYGYPEPTISWSGPRNALPIGRYHLNSFNSQLIINNVRTTDEGDYYCAGSNTIGRTTNVLQIRVEEAPVFRSVKDGPYNVNVTEGESLTFNCNVSAKPDATIVWLRDGVELDVSNPPRRFAFSNNKKSLTIRKVCRDCVDRERKTDLMVIQCNASNVHGYAFAQGYLNVLSGSQTPRPGPQPRPVSVPTKVIAYLRDANKANRVFPKSGLRPSSGLIYEAPSALSRRYISTLRLWIPEKFAGIYSVTVFNRTKARNISDAMDVCFREAELSGPSLFLVDKLDTLYPKASASDLGRKADVERLLQGTTRTLRSTFVLFLGFVEDVNNLNPALIQSGTFGRA